MSTVKKTLSDEKENRIEMLNVRSLRVTEPRSFDSDASVTFTRYTPDFGTDMFSLSITISPNEQMACISSLFLDVFRNCLIVGFNKDENAGIEKRFWRTRIPILVFWRKFGFCKMSKDTCHGHTAISP